ncbi:hypothetical protein [Candidatus Oleimmundimicrobium sp.]|uniref:TadE/TadG family type IV pilus assembly protein n=1 Tax=Candidatus Oleimmundimicrobium sp. TaxID=3060597 RepID=UPI00272081B6|nr:hypothetical protein [Candidatus Oleimmundimicrobium sp.]MDO8886673.1 hypothetical protein [Candidatus Oleimmundimicrobium sp.]
MRALRDEKGSAFIFMCLIFTMIFFIFMAIESDIARCLSARKALAKSCDIAADEASEEISIQTAEATGASVVQYDRAYQVAWDYLNDNIGHAAGATLKDMELEIQKESIEVRAYAGIKLSPHNGEKTIKARGVAKLRGMTD